MVDRLSVRPKIFSSKILGRTVSGKGKIALRVTTQICDTYKLEQQRQFCVANCRNFATTSQNLVRKRLQFCRRFRTVLRETQNCRFAHKNSLRKFLYKFARGANLRACENRASKAENFARKILEKLEKYEIFHFF